MRGPSRGLHKEETASWSATSVGRGGPDQVHARIAARLPLAHSPPCASGKIRRVAAKVPRRGAALATQAGADPARAGSNKAAGTKAVTKSRPPAAPAAAIAAAGATIRP